MECLHDRARLNPFHFLCLASNMVQQTLFMEYAFNCNYYSKALNLSLFKFYSNNPLCTTLQQECAIPITCNIFHVVIVIFITDVLWVFLVIPESITMHVISVGT